MGALAQLAVPEPGWHRGRRCCSLRRYRAAPGDLPAGRRPPIVITKEGDVVTAALAGDFDMQATFTVEPALERALETPGVRRIELDLRGLEFIDSTGMGVIVRLDREARGRGVQLRLRRGPRPVHHVFEKSGLADALPFTSPDS
jgi:anti-anti-sigma factor